MWIRTEERKWERKKVKGEDIGSGFLDLLKVSDTGNGKLVSEKDDPLQE